MIDNKVTNAIEWLERLKRDTDVSEWAESITIILDEYRYLLADREALIAGQETLQKAIAEKIDEINGLYKKVNEIMVCSVKIERELSNIVSEAENNAISVFAEKLLSEINEAIKSNHTAKKQRVSRLDELGVVRNDEFCSYYDGKIHALCGIVDFIHELINSDNYNSSKEVGVNVE